MGSHLDCPAVLGTLVIVWQWGWGTEAVLGVVPDGSIGTFVPVTVFAFLFGLTMDYEVFLLSRIKEEHDRTGNTETAVVSALGRTGRLINAAAVILFFSFASMAMTRELDVAVFASGVALGTSSMSLSSADSSSRHSSPLLDATTGGSRPAGAAPRRSSPTLPGSSADRRRRQ
ncbi:MMPL family transporter [Sinosporangium siamense]|uniref:Membrane transport protein MMPL domain-containing protein n=1 Tax=Sinosporangium siamense TaxID=1367973 RepID=A0A919RK26_9ACTN|nr:MMPL family transporter [Sinosporangium siamense]GII95272.1 hypothetical protein Ssi02_55030 [Sinosporangium siamense]